MSFPFGNLYITNSQIKETEKFWAVPKYETMFIVRDNMMSKNYIFICLFCLFYLFVLLYVQCITGTIVREIYSQNVKAYEGTYEDTKSLHISKAEAIIHCLMKCLNADRCVSFFSQQNIEQVYSAWRYLHIQSGKSLDLDGNFL